jgi:hypothetical protein
MSRAEFELQFSENLASQSGPLPPCSHLGLALRTRMRFFVFSVTTSRKKYWRICDQCFLPYSQFPAKLPFETSSKQCSQSIKAKKNTIHEHVWRSGGIAPPFLTSTLDGGEWSASRPSRFTHEERDPCTLCTGSWVGPTVGLVTVEKRKI